MTRPVQDDDALYELDAFINLVLEGVFTDYDGFGEWATEFEVFEGCDFNLTLLDRDPERPAGATHVVWYNK